MRAALAQGKLGTGSLWIFSVVASSPLTVLVGGLPTMYSATGVIGVPVAFVLVSLVLGFLVTGYVSAARHIRHTAVLYALLARGLTPTLGVAGGLVALLGYNAVQISLYGLAGATLAGIAGGNWVAWAIGVWTLVTALGLLGGVISARVLGCLLAIELSMILFYDLTAFANPAGGVVHLTALSPSQLFVPGASGALAFAMAASVGVETAPAYVEEARGGRCVRRATLGAVAFTGAFYAFAALAMSVHTGSADLAAVGGDPTQGPLSLIGQVFGSGVAWLATVLLVTSIIAAMTSFHSTVNRYVFSMARERVLPKLLSRLSRHGDGGTPIAASLLQSTIAGAAIFAAAELGVDPVAGLFTWLSTIGAVAILVVLVVASGAVYRFFVSGQGTDDGMFVRQAAPIAGCVLGGLLAVMMIANLRSLLGLPAGSRLTLAVPLVIAATGIVGLIWGAVVRRVQPDIWAQIGRVVPNPVIMRVARLERLEM